MAYVMQRPMGEYEGKSPLVTGAVTAALIVAGFFWLVTKAK